VIAFLNEFSILIGPGLVIFVLSTAMTMMTVVLPTAMVAVLATFGRLFGFIGGGPSMLWPGLVLVFSSHGEI
jgi:hypothetical protein